MPARPLERGTGVHAHATESKPRRADGSNPRRVHAGPRVVDSQGSFAWKRLDGLPRAHNPPSLPHALANRFGTSALFALLDKYGWQLGRPCQQVGAPHARLVLT